MRRFAGYLAIVVTLILTVAFNISHQIGDLNLGLEYGSGYEAVYRVDFEESSKDIEDIVNIVTQRIEDAEVRNGNVESFSDDDRDEHQIRIKANSQTAEEFEYILRSAESTGEITVSAVLNEGDYAELVDPFVRGSATVEWSGSTPYVSVDVKDYDAFNSFVTACNDAYKKFNEEYNTSEDDSESTIDGVIVVWLDKTETDSYLEAFENENEVIQEEVKSKILSIIPTSYFQVTKDINDKVTSAKLLIDRYDFDQIQMVGQSAHTIERLLNYEPQDYSLTRLYVQRVSATYGSQTFTIMLIGLGIAVLAAVVFLIVRYGLAGLSGGASLGLSALLILIVFNFFGYTVTTMVFIAFILSVILNLAFLIPLLENFREELLKGKNVVKASQEAFSSSKFTALDILICSLLVNIVTIAVSINQVKLLPITLLIATIVSYVVDRLLMRLMMWWLTHSKVGENKRIYGVKESDCPVVSRDEVQKKFNFMHKYDPVRPNPVGRIGNAVLSVLCAAIIAVFAFVPSLSAFHYTDEFNTTTRIEITSEMTTSHHLFETKKSVVDFFEEHYQLTPSSVEINLVENVITDSSNRDDLPTIAYISVGFDSVISFSYEEYEALQLSIRDLDYGENAEVYIGTTESNMPNYILRYSISTLLVFGLVASAYYLIRFKVSYGIATLSTVVSPALWTLAILIVSRIPASPLVLMGVASGLFIGSLIQIPLFSRMKKLTRESKTRALNFDQRKEIAVEANRESLHVVVKLGIISLAGILLLACFSPVEVLSVYIGMALALLFVLLECLTFTPVYLAVEKGLYSLKVKWLSKRQDTRKEKGKKRLKKIKEAHKNVGSEPEEATIPGIND